MADKATTKQIEYLRNLGFKTGAKLTKEQATAKIDELLAREREQGVALNCPFCKGELRKRPKRSVTCPHCKQKVIHRRGKLYKLEDWQKKEQAEWQKEEKAFRRENIRDSLQMQRELWQLGGRDPADEPAGFVIRIGKNCSHVKHLDGLIVLVDDATKDPDLLPPYDGCQCDSCECDFTLVTKGEVPRGTRVAQRRVAEPVPPTKHRGAQRRQTKRPKGCLRQVSVAATVLGLAVGATTIAILWVIAR